MTFRQARDLFTYWQESPPENEILAMLAKVYTTWRPGPPLTEEQAMVEHRKSLELRWKAGAMNPKQIFESMGGRLGVGASDHPYSGLQMTGIGQWPPKF